MLKSVWLSTDVAVACDEILCSAVKAAFAAIECVVVVDSDCFSGCTQRHHQESSAGGMPHKPTTPAALHKQQGCVYVYRREHECASCL